MEKLTAGSPVTKVGELVLSRNANEGLFPDCVPSRFPTHQRDTLEALQVCLPVYGSAAADTNSKKLWNCLRLEIFQPIDVETEDSALLATQALVKTIYGDQDVQIDDVKGFAKGIMQEFLDILKQPEKSQAQHAIKTICALLSTTRKQCTPILE